MIIEKESRKIIDSGKEAERSGIMRSNRARCGVLKK